MGKGFYKVLGVEREANEKKLKKAYRKFTMKYYSDKNQNNVEEAQAKFQEVSEAYDILSYSKKRKIYDQFGEERIKVGVDPNMNSSSNGAQLYTSRCREPF
jgi:DnaJ-class molecular chaperone